MKTWQEYLEHEQDERRKFLQSALEKHGTYTAAADALEMDRAYFYRLRRKHGLERADTDADRRSRRKAYADCAAAGLTQAETAEKLGVTRSSVENAAWRYGIRFKPAKRGPAKGVAPQKPAPEPKSQPAPKKPMTPADYAAAENAAMRKVGRV